MRGHVRQRSKGSWSLVIDSGRDPVTGKRRQMWRTVRGTKKQAEAELARWISSVETGVDLDPTRLSLAAYLARWLESMKPRVAATTWERYERLVRVQVGPALGAVPLSKLRPLHLEKLYASLLADGLSAQSVLHVHRLLFASLRQAVKWQLLPRNVAEAVTPPRPRHKRTEALSTPDALRVTDAVKGTALEVPVLLGLGTGMRRGEILGLRWQDVDLEAGRVRVTQTVQHIGNQLHFVPPKTHRSERSVSLPAFVVEALRAHKVAQNARRLLLGASWQETDLVLERGDGGALRPDTMSKQFRKATRRLGLDLHFHGLRHAHASLLLLGGVHLKVVSDRLGHSTIGITADLYSHVAPALEEQAAVTIDGFLGGASGHPR